ncbi:MAG: ExbD/TolR family protein [Burkholderiales bacterium]
MNFRHGPREDLEINLVPLIDVLLVILIFLMITTTYSRYSELKINLPTAKAEKSVEKPNEVNVGIDAAGHYVIDKTPTAFASPDDFSDALKRAAKGNPTPTIVINADANASHQSVINVMEAARIAGFSRITFTTQTTPQ